MKRTIIKKNPGKSDTIRTQSKGVQNSIKAGYGFPLILRPKQIIIKGRNKALNTLVYLVPIDTNILSIKKKYFTLCKQIKKGGVKMRVSIMQWYENQLDEMINNHLTKQECDEVWLHEQSKNLLDELINEVKKRDGQIHKFKNMVKCQD